MSGLPGLVLRPAGVDSTVLVVNRGYYEDTGLLTDHGGGHHRVGRYYVSLQVPGYGHRHVSTSYHASELSKLSLVDALGSEGERNNLRWFYK